MATRDMMYHHRFIHHVPDAQKYIEIMHEKFSGKLYSIYYPASSRKLNLELNDTHYDFSAVSKQVNIKVTENRKLLAYASIKFDGEIPTISIRQKRKNCTDSKLEEILENLNPPGFVRVKSP